MLSSAYQQSSVGDEATQNADPDNLLFGRMNRRRLEAEALRDSLLAVAGRLDRTMGGKAIPVTELNTPRRTLYLMTIRSDRNNYRALFDAADPGSIVEKRNESTVAPQALFLMNHPFVREQANAAAAKLLAEPGLDDARRTVRAYRLALGRAPTDAEMKGVREFLSSVGPADARAQREAWSQVFHALFGSIDFRYVE
jgi:hypothetical protein